MIVRRLTVAIKRQGRFQVTIEILIVVNGIFLGLQVLEWSNLRSEQQEEISTGRT